MHYGFVSSKIYDKHDYLYFDIVNFPFWDGDFPRVPSYGVYISPIIRFASVSSHLSDSSARNKTLNAKLLQQGYRYHKLRTVFFSKFHRRHYELVSKYDTWLKTLLLQVLSEPKFQGDLVYKQKGKRKVWGVPQSQTAALPRPQEEEETDKSKQAQTEQTYEKH